MTIVFHKQLLRHDPENGVYGDCWRTCIANLFGLKPDEVPHFYANGGGYEASRSIQDWLTERGHGIVSLTFEGTIEDLPKLQMRVASDNIGSYYILLGMSKTGVNHAVIGLNHEIVFDPGLDNPGIVGPCDTGYFVFQFIAAFRGAPALRITS